MGKSCKGGMHTNLEFGNHFGICFATKEGQGNGR